MRLLSVFLMQRLHVEEMRKPPSAKNPWSVCSGARRYLSKQGVFYRLRSVVLSCCRKIGAKTSKSTVRGSSEKACCSACLQAISATWGFTEHRWPRRLRTPLFALLTCPVPSIWTFSGRKKRQAGRRERGITRAAFRLSSTVLESRIRQAGLRFRLRSGVASDAACVRAAFLRLHAELCRGSILHGEPITFRRLGKGARGACRQLEPWRVATKKQFAQ